MSPAKSLVDKITSFVIDLALLPLASSSPQRAESTSGRLPSPLPLAWLAALGITSFLLEGSLPVDQMRDKTTGNARRYSTLLLVFPAWLQYLGKTPDGKSVRV
jgi:hypothetical protein